MLELEGGRMMGLARCRRLLEEKEQAFAWLTRAGFVVVRGPENKDKPETG